jgi:hypothetical protein
MGVRIEVRRRDWDSNPDIQRKQAHWITWLNYTVYSRPTLTIKDDCNLRDTRLRDLGNTSFWTICSLKDYLYQRVSLNKHLFKSEEY